MPAIDTHAHWFPPEWIALLHAEGPANGATMGVNHKGHETIQLPGVPLVSSFPTYMVDLDIMVRNMNAWKGTCAHSRSPTRWCIGRRLHSA